MTRLDLSAHGHTLPGAPGWRTQNVSPEEWVHAAQELAGSGARLAALWASSGERGAPIVRAAFFTGTGPLLLNLPLDETDALYPGLEELFPCAARMQRATTSSAFSRPIVRER